MIIYLTGSDSYLAKQAIDQLKQKYLAKNPTGVEIREIDAEDQLPNWADLQAVPLFSTSRLVIIKRVGQLLSAEQTNLATFLQQLPSTTVVAIWDEKALSPSTPLAQALTRAEKTIEVRPLASTELTTWLKRQAKNYQLNLTEAQLGHLIYQFGADLWALVAELRSLQTNQALLAASDWRPTVESEPFIYFKLVRSQNWLALAKQLKSDWHSGVAIELMIGSLAAAVRKERSMSLRQALTDLLADLDLGLKAGLLEPEAAVALLISHLPNPRPTRVQWERLWEETRSL